MDRPTLVHEAFLRRAAEKDFAPGAAPVSSVSDAEAIALYKAQCLSRALDLESRAMQKRGEGYYTIGSSGHEGMAAVAHALKITDPAFLHYRDAAFQIARASKAGHGGILEDMVLSFACAKDDPISGGRHKVLGSKDLMIPPQTSTIASHLPKALGAAYSITLAKRAKPEHRYYPADAIAFCSFGDASLNHSTAQGAINAASWTVAKGMPLPLLFCCEDNGIGISVKTPTGWVQASMEHRPNIKYFTANALDFYESVKVAKEAAAYVRTQKKPAFLHLKMIRLYGHAGADVATSYLPRAEVEAQEAHDPLLHSVRLLSEAGAMTPEDALAVYKDTLEDVKAEAARLGSVPRLQTADEVMASIIPPLRQCAKTNGPSDEERAKAFGRDLPKPDERMTIARSINMALTDLMLAHPEITIMGEDVGKKGGVYGVTQKLQSRFGPARVVDTLLDEQSILGLSIGLGQNGFVPMPEIQFLAYLHNAEDQIRGEAATLPFFSNGQFTNPMVIRIASLGYQRGFGGHFHNDNSIAVLRDIPGVIVACPSRGDDAALMLRECVRLAREEQRIVVFLEPIALYHTKDLSEAGDEKWLGTYPGPADRLSLGDIGIEGDGSDLAIVTYGNGRFLSEQARAEIEAAGTSLRVIDLRWIAPLSEDAIVAAAKECKNVLIVDECRKTGGQAEALMALFAEAGLSSVKRLTAKDSFIATGPAYGATLPSKDDIVKMALSF